MATRPDGIDTTVPDIAAAYALVDLDPPTLQRKDVAARTGVAPERSMRWWRAMGFSEVADEDVAFREADVEMVRELDALIRSGAIEEAVVLRLARLMGASFSRLVDAQLDAVDSALVADDDPRPPGSRPTGLLDLVGAENSIFDFMETSMSYVWRRHLLAAISHRFSTARPDIDRTVGFADLSGFSRVSKRAGSAELAQIIDTFETTAFDVISGHGGRVVKLIGDEVMFVTDDIDEAVTIGIDLIARLEAVEGMPPIHCGLASGPTISVGGDVFGPTVNLASRLTTVARPGSLVVPREGGEHLLDRNDLDVRRVRRGYDLKGIGRTAVIVIRPAPKAQPDPP